MKKALKIIAMVLVICLITQVFAVCATAQTDDYLPYNDQVGENQTFDDEYSQKSDAYILSEDISKRTETEKHFRMSDGSYTVATYNYPIHYKDSDGNWENIDNTLVSLNEEEYINKDSRFSATLSKKMRKDKVVELNVNGHKLSWGFINANKSSAEIQENTEELTGDERFLNLNKIKSKTIYRDIYNDVDAEYILSSTGIKENIILKSKSAPTEFEVEYKINGLTVNQVDDKTIELTDSDGNFVYAINAPVMMDSNSSYSTALSLSIISNSNSKLLIKLTADKQWLNDPNRAYPVTVDPFVYTDQKIKTIYSVSLFEEATGGTYPYGSLYVGRSNEYERSVSLVEMSLPELSDGDMVVSGKIILCQTNFSSYTNSDVQVNVSKIDSSWSASNFIDLQKSQGCYELAPSAGPKIDDFVVCNHDTSYERLAWDITGTVKEWYSGSPNYGVMFWSNDPDERSYAYFVRAENGIDYTAEEYPTIIINYINSIGLESLWSYSSMGTTTHGAAFVNRYTGNLVVTESVMNTTGNRLPMDISVTYNSLKYDDHYKDSVSVGHGFMLNFQQRVDLVTDTELTGKGYKYIYTDSDGTEHYFRKKDGSTTEWVDEEGLGLTLTETGASGNGIYITSKDGHELHFYLPSISSIYAGMLYHSKDIYGNTIRYYSTKPVDDCNIGAITSIKDGAGRMAYITYAKYTSGGKTVLRPTKITDHQSYEYTFTYSGAKLSTITYPAHDGAVTTFTYDGAGRMTSVADSVAQTKTDITYLSADGLNMTKVKSIAATVLSGTSYTSAERLTYDYSIYNTTKETNLDSKTTTFQFDNVGRLTGVIAHDGSVGHIEYNDFAQPSTATSAHSEAAKNNSVNNSNISNAYVNNLLSNPSAEVNANYYNFVDAGSGTSQSYDSTVAYLGSRSIKIDHDTTSITDSGKAQQVMLSETVNTPFTFSAYVKTSNVTAVGTDPNFTKGAAVSMNFYDASGNRTLSVPGNTYISGTTDWTRISVTGTAPAGTKEIRVYCAIRNATGVAWFDCLQLEQNDAMNALNLLENSDFTTTSNWTTANYESGDGITSGKVKVTGKAGNTSGNKFIYQNIPVNKANVGFNLYGKITSGTMAAERSGRLCAVEICIRYANGSTSNYFTKNFNETLDTEQYVNVMAYPKLRGQVISSVGVYFIFRDNANTVYLDNMMLNIDETGTVYDYDDNGNLITSDDNAARNQTYTYNNANELTEYTDSKGEVYEYIYSPVNEHKLLAVRSNQIGNGYQFVHDDYGNIIKTTMGTHYYSTGVDFSQPTISTSTTYSEDGSYVTSQTNARNKTTTYDINEADGRVYITTTPVTVGGASTTSSTYYSYNNKKLLSSVSADYQKNTQYVDYTYDGRNRLTDIDSATSSYELSYNHFNSMTQTKVGNRTLITNMYSKSGRGPLTSSLYGNGTRVVYNYDDNDRLTSKLYNGIPVMNITYNKQSQVARRVDYAGGYTTDYNYDIAGRLVQSQQSQGRNARTTYKYDNQNRIKLQTNYINGFAQEFAYQYGADNLLEYCWNGGYTFNYTYNNLNLPTQQKVVPMSGVELKNVYSYETGSTLITRNEYYKNGESQEYYTYTYDDAGNIKTISKDGVLQKSYNYDKLGQLETEYNYDTLKYYQYEYDYGGNITRKITLNILYSPENGITGMSYAGERSYVYGDETWGDLLTNYNGQTITYDAIGNPLQYYGGRSFTWSNGRQLTSLQKGNDVVSYTYNADGLRNTKTVNGVTTQYYYDDSGRLICLKNPTDELWLYYDLGTSPTSMRHNGTRYLFLKNIQGDVTAIVNSAGTVMARYTYDSWGTVLSITDGNGNSITNNPNHIGNINPIRYRGYYYDTESSLYYLNTRYYDPNTGRFINADGYISTGQGILGNNMYAYCLNNPINMVDADGCDPVPMWAININSGKATQSDYDQALTADARSWVGSARNSVDRAINTARKKAVEAEAIDSILGVMETGIQSGLELGKHAYKTAPRPSNIGIGTYSKYISQKIAFLDDISSLVEKASNNLTYLSIGIEACIGAYENYQAGASFGKIAWDASVDIAFSTAIAVISTEVGTMIGTALLPGAGSAAGAACGLVIGIFLDVALYEARVKFKSWVR